MRELAAGLIRKKFMGEKGIFLTFMSFLLVSTLLTLSISISQAGIGQEKNLAEEVAFKSVNNAFNSMLQQTTVAKEGYAGAAYSRIMPFSSFEADENWIEIGQITADSEYHLKNTYNALNLFAVFAEEKGQSGTQVNIKSVIQDSEWGGTESYPQLTYLVLPQCLKFSAGDGTTGASAVKFEGGTTTSDGCLQDFAPASIKSQEFEISFALEYDEILCGGVFSTGIEGECKGPDNGNVKISIIDQSGTQTIRADLDGEESNYVEVVLTEEPNFRLEFSNYVAKIANGEGRSNAFSAKIVFNEPFDEIVLAPGQFEFWIRNQGFGVCRATSEEGCVP